MDLALDKRFTGEFFSAAEERRERGQDVRETWNLNW